MNYKFQALNITLSEVILSTKKTMILLVTVVVRIFPVEIVIFVLEGNSSQRTLPKFRSIRLKKIMF